MRTAKQESLECKNKNNSNSPYAIRECLLRDYLQPSHDLEQTSNILGRVLPLRKIKAPTPPDVWWQEVGAFPNTTLPMVAWVGSPIALETRHQPQNILFLLHNGTANLIQGTHQVQLSSGEGVILSGSSFTLDCRSSNATGSNSATVCILDRSSLLQEVNSLAQSDWAYMPDAVHRHQNPLVLRRQPQKHLYLMNAIDHLLLSFFQLASLHTELQKDMLPIQSLMRLLSMLFLDLIQESTHPLESTLKFILANLGRTLTLSEIEKFSNYSSRGLQHAFHDYCGCSPMKWIQMQRLNLAHKCLLNPNLDAPIYKIAFACGYRSSSRFSQDYKKVFGVSPCVTIRRKKLSI
jgi:AraC-like DNA-binding protein